MPLYSPNFAESSDTYPTPRFGVNVKPGSSNVQNLQGHFEVSTSAASSAPARITGARADTSSNATPRATEGLMWLPFMNLSHQLHTRRVVGAVDLGMTVQAGATEQEGRRISIGQSRAGAGDARVASLRVALLAEQWGPLDEQRRVDGAMRRVAIGAILGDRRVLPQDRTALLGVTAVAGLVQRGLDQQFRCHRAMNFVAGAALHLREAHRMHRGLVELGALHLVTGVAHLRL